MRFTGIKELKQKTMGVIEACKTEDVIITAYGKPTAILHYITEEDLADYLLENGPLFHRKIEAAYTEYTRAGGLTADELIKKLEHHHQPCCPARSSFLPLPSEKTAPSC